MLGGGLWLAVGLRMRGSLVDDCVLAGVQGRAIRLGAAGSLLSGKDVQLLSKFSAGLGRPIWNTHVLFKPRFAVDG